MVNIKVLMQEALMALKIARRMGLTLIGLMGLVVMAAAGCGGGPAEEDAATGGDSPATASKARVESGGSQAGRSTGLLRGSDLAWRTR